MSYHSVMDLDDGGLWSELFGDRFHSSSGGGAEAEHVFLSGNGLPGRWSDAEEFTIAELGFGTGLNFLQTIAAWRLARAPGQQLVYVAFEAYPLSGSDFARFHERQGTDDDRARLMELWSDGAVTDRFADVDEQTRLLVVRDDALTGLVNTDLLADAWYLDGFSPQNNPQMWSRDLMQAVFDHTAPGGTFSTYTAAGHVRRALSDAGFEVERVPGFGRKRHMTIGKRLP